MPLPPPPPQTRPQAQIKKPTPTPTLFVCLLTRPHPTARTHARSWLSFLERHAPRLDAVRVLAMLPERATPLQLLAPYLTKVRRVAATPTTPTTMDNDTQPQHQRQRDQPGAAAVRDGAAAQGSGSPATEGRGGETHTHTDTRTRVHTHVHTHAAYLSTTHIIIDPTPKKKQQLKIQQELVHEQSRRVTITEDTLCRVPSCRRPIGALCHFVERWTKKRSQRSSDDVDDDSGFDVSCLSGSFLLIPSGGITNNRQHRHSLLPERRRRPFRLRPVRLSLLLSCLGLPPPPTPPNPAAHVVRLPSSSTITSIHIHIHPHPGTTCTRVL